MLDNIERKLDKTNNDTIVDKLIAERDLLELIIYKMGEAQYEMEKN